MLTYGDGLSDVNIRKLLNFHKNKKIATLTAVRPQQDLEQLEIKGNKVKYFKEKIKIGCGLDKRWFFCF